MKKLSPYYQVSVFLNCPFDDDFKPLRSAIVFTVIQCGFIVRCADENHTEKNRFSRIIKMIDESKYGIHDLSRIELSKLPRNNMPLELGIFIGCKEYKDKKKDYLVLDSEPHRYKQHTTDLGGQDPGIHHNDSREIIKCVRDWLAPKSDESSIVPSTSIIFEKYEKFLAEAPEYCKKRHLIFEELTFSEFHKIVTNWLKHERELIKNKLNIPKNVILD